MTTERRRRARKRGLTAEALCLALLRLKGYRVLARDLKTPVGELDIVARRGAVLAGVEVKRRKTSAEAAEAIGPGQRLRIARAAWHFLAGKPALAALSVRFDAMLVTPWRLPRHLRDAWRPDARDEW